MRDGMIGKDGQVLSRIGTVTPKHFKMVPMQDAGELLPTGVIDYKRMELRKILPQLGDISLATYYYLRIACCAHMMVAGADKLEDCEVCRGNRGYVCPFCLGAGWMRSPYRQCLHCCIERIGEKNKIVTEYDPERELNSVKWWLARHFPFGVPKNPTQEELQVMDSL